MDELHRPVTAPINRAPAPPRGPDNQPNTNNNLIVNKKQPNPRRKKLIGLLVGLVVLVLLASGVYYFYKQQSQTAVGGNGYQAVFLTNGQVYFGKLHKSQNGFLTMSDIYYLQVQQPQPSGSAVADATKSNQQDSAATDTQLVKLGQELHAPEDRMVINKDQVLFWENIKDSGKVVQAIDAYKAKK